MEKRNAESVTDNFCRTASGIWWVSRWGEILHKTSLSRKKVISTSEWSLLKEISLKFTEEMRSRGPWIGRGIFEKILLDFIEYSATFLYDPCNSLLATLPSAMCIKYLISDRETSQKSDATSEVDLSQSSKPELSHGNGSQKEVTIEKEKKRRPSEVVSDDHGGNEVVVRGKSPIIRHKLGSKPHLRNYQKKSTNESLVNVRKDTPPLDLNFAQPSRSPTEASFFLSGKATLSKGQGSQVTISQDRVRSPSSPPSLLSSQMEDHASLHHLILRWDLLMDYPDMVMREIAMSASDIRKSYRQRVGELVLLELKHLPFPYK